MCGPHLTFHFPRNVQKNLEVFHLNRVIQYVIHTKIKEFIVVFWRIRNNSIFVLMLKLRRWSQGCLQFTYLIRAAIWLIILTAFYFEIIFILKIFSETHKLFSNVIFAFRNIFTNWASWQFQNFHRCGNGAAWLRAHGKAQRACSHCTVLKMSENVYQVVSNPM